MSGPLVRSHNASEVSQFDKTVSERFVWLGFSKFIDQHFRIVIYLLVDNHRRTIQTPILASHCQQGQPLKNEKHGEDHEHQAGSLSTNCGRLLLLR